jgi:hypothetical protein
MFSEQLGERQALAQANITTINSGGTASINTGNGLNMGELARARAFFHSGGTVGGSVTCKLQASATSGGSYTDISGAAATAITGTHKLETIEIRADQMPAGKPWLRALAQETGGADCIMDLLLIGDEAKHAPGSQWGTTTPDQTLVV